MKIEYQLIGVVHSPFRELEDIPDQPYFAQGVKDTVEVFYVDELDKLKDVRIGWLGSVRENK